ncbi:hypothetical protein [Fusobacterium periodonticum]|uniref:Baseplate protein J-like domain-containing protein n=1 Tax=Fusobacterium periodonticum ATCC 33693 TaxID=546275 RepID=D4CXQ1_9FUSO|nr:hypothetical protein [Fusobacterium periodonticum]EFE85890.1 hypothetical protein FUSPEROL_02248 [Fusobacterium periodonticum ATCC 33693]
MYNIENGNFNIFLEKISEKLGFKIDNSSFDYDILKSLFEINVSFKKEYEKLLDGIIFENLKGKDLDNFLSFFNIIRKKNNNDELYTLVLKFNVNNNSFIIKEGCIINIDNKSYKNIKTTSINNEKELLTVQKISKQDIIKQIIGNNGSIIFDENYVSVNTGNINDVSSNLLFLGFNINNVEQETDFEFLERAKNILQSYGYNNKEKIKFELLKDERIKNIKIKENDNVTEIIIYPKELSKIDEIINFNKHLVDYYKNSIVELVNPNLYIFNIKNIKEQIYYIAYNEEIIKELEEYMKSYFNSVFVENNNIIFSRIDFIVELKKFFSNKPQIQLNYDLVEIEYQFFYKNNYQDFIYSKILDDELKIKDENIISFGSVS